jgi:hypothetical protein
MELDIEDNKVLFDFLQSRGLRSKPIIIGIDGSTGVGKSNLAYCIGCKFNIPVINIDHYVEEIHDSYKEAVALEPLDKLTKRYRNTERSYVIEGVCLLEILEALYINPDILLYYKLYNSRKEWVDEDACSCVVTEDELKLLPPLRRAIAKYHNKYRPIDQSSCTVYRIDTHGGFNLAG